MGANGNPDRAAKAKYGGAKAAIDAINAGREAPILVRKLTYLNDIVEQDHRAIKQVTGPPLNFKSFRSASSMLAGIRLMHMIHKGQFELPGAEVMSFTGQFSAMARWSVQFERHITFPHNFCGLINNATKPGIAHAPCPNAAACGSGEREMVGISVVIVMAQIAWL